MFHLFPIPGYIHSNWYVWQRAAPLQFALLFPFESRVLTARFVFARHEKCGPLAQILARDLMQRYLTPRGRKTPSARPLEGVKAESRCSLRFLTHSVCSLIRLVGSTGGRQLTGKQRCAHFAVAQKSSFTHQKKRAPDFNPLNFHAVPQRCISVKRKSLFSPWLCPLLRLDVQATAPEETRMKNAAAEGQASGGSKKGCRDFAKSPRPCLIHKTSPLNDAQVESES